MDVCTLAFTATTTLLGCFATSCAVEGDVKYCEPRPCEMPQVVMSGWDCTRPDGTHYTRPYYNGMAR